MDTSFLSDLILAAVVIEALTEAFVDAEPMEPVRHWIGKWHPLLAVLVNCGKCSSFWIAIVVVLLPSAWVATLALPAGAWRLAGLWHDGLTWALLRKEKVRADLE